MTMQMRTIVLIGFSILLSYSCTTKKKYTIDGELQQWHKVTLSFQGPESGEDNEINPFLDYRLVVTFKNGDDEFVVPGYYAADGNAAESSATNGNIWQVRFAPNKPGKWKFSASFMSGKDIAVSTIKGTSTAFDGLTGAFRIIQSTKPASSWKSKGRLTNTGGHYLRHGGDNSIFIKGGVDSPENLLGYIDFDNTAYGGARDEQREGESQTNSKLHHYLPHVQDWNDGDPTWKDGKGKGLIGGLNYLNSKGINSVYMITNNVNGDGKDVYPWTTYDQDFSRYDVSKLAQWEIVFDHMDDLGIMCHFVTQETENELLLNNGNTGTERKLYYRELIARFSHHLGVTWNLGEENGPAPWMDHVGQTDQQRKDMASYIKSVDPYGNLLVLHTLPNLSLRDSMLTALLDFEPLDGPSLQTQPHEVHKETKKWRVITADRSKKWIVCSDEIGPHWAGALPDSVDPNHDTIRGQVLWGNLMAGGAGVEWYFGYRYAHNDLNCEDWRSRDLLFNQTKIALDFFTQQVTIENFKPNDELVTAGYAMSAANGEIICYKPLNKTTVIKLPEGTYELRWLNPRYKDELSNPIEISGGYQVLASMPNLPNQDWVALIKPR